MAKKQTRRSISISRKLYDGLKAYTESVNISMSQLVEQGIRAIMDGSLPLQPPTEKEVRDAAPTVPLDERAAQRATNRTIERITLLNTAISYRQRVGIDASTMIQERDSLLAAQPPKPTREELDAMAQERDRARICQEHERMAREADTFAGSRPVPMELSGVLKEDLERAAEASGEKPGDILDGAVNRMLDHLESHRWCRRCLLDSYDCPCRTQMVEAVPANGGVR